MSCKSEIYVVNSTNGTVTTDAGTFVQIPFGSVVRRYGQSLGLDGSSILCCSRGYFDIKTSLTFTPTAAGPVTLQIWQDGRPLQGATATQQGTAGNPINLSFPSVARNCAYDCNSNLTAWIDAPGNIVNFSTVVEKQ